MIGRRFRTFLTLAAWAYMLLGLYRAVSGIVSTLLVSPTAPHALGMVPAWERAAWSIGETFVTGGILLILLSIDQRLERKV